ncbi:MAG: hypothetical protein AAF108_00095 [Planctomycetota bacterium]
MRDDAERLIEAKTGVGAPVEPDGDLLLSPRVIDEAAFDRYATLLRTIAGDAGRAAASAREATRRARSVLGSDAAARLGDLDLRLDALQAHLEAARATTAGAKDAAARASEVTQNIEKVALAASDTIERQRSGLDELRARVERAVGDTIATLKTSTVGAASLVEDAGARARRSVQAEAEAVHASLTDFEALERDAREAAREAGAAVIDEIADAAVSRVREVVRDQLLSAEKAVRGLETRVRRASGSLEALEARATSLTQAAGPTEASITTLEDRIDRAERRLAGVNQTTLDRLTRLLDRSDTLLGPGSVERLTAVLDRGDSTAKRLEGLEKQAAVAVDGLASAILSSAGKMDVLLAKNDGLRATLDAAVPSETPATSSRPRAQVPSPAPAKKKPTAPKTTTRAGSAAAKAARGAVKPGPHAAAATAAASNAESKPAKNAAAKAKPRFRRTDRPAA